MRSRDDVYEADADASRSEEETKEKHSTNSRHGSQRSSSSKNNPIVYTEQERAEFLTRLDSIKDHLLRGNAVTKPKETDENQPFIRPIHLYGPNPGPSYYHHPYPYRRPPPIPNWYPPGHYPHQMTPSYFPATPSRYGDMPPYSHVSSHHRGGTPYSPPVNNSPSFPSSMSSPGPPSDLDSKMGGAFARGYVKKAVSDTDARRCHPLAGGAPFIACHSCFELLYLPKNKLLAHKLQCGACSEVTSFTIVDKKLVFSSVSLEVEDKSTANTVVVEEPIHDLRNHRETTQSIRSESQHSYEEERSSISSEQQHIEVKSVRRRVKSSKVPEPTAPESASLLELFEYSNVNRAALAYGMADLGYNKQEFFMKQDSLKPESETEVSYNGYSEDSRYSNGREDNNRPRSRKGSESCSTTKWCD